MTLRQTAVSLAIVICGSTLAQQGQQSAEMERAKQAANKDVSHANNLIQAGRYEEALESLRKWSNQSEYIDQTYAPIARLRRECYLKLNRINEAVEPMRDLVEASYDYHSINARLIEKANLSALLWITNQKEEARSIATPQFKSQVLPELRKQLKYLPTGDCPDAEFFAYVFLNEANLPREESGQPVTLTTRLAELALRSNPLDPHANYIVGEKLLKSDKDKAIAMLTITAQSPIKPYATLAKKLLSRTTL